MAEVAAGENGRPVLLSAWSRAAGERVGEHALGIGYDPGVPPAVVAEQAADLCKSSVYTGMTYAVVGFAAIEHEQMPHGPREAVYDRDELYTRPQPRTRWHDPANWLAQEHPAVAGFLAPEVRRAAELKQAGKRMQRYESGLKPRPAHTGGGSKHRSSQYLLSGLLRTKEGDVLTGILCGPRGNTRRAYRVRKSCRETEPRHRLRTQIAAGPLEGALYKALGDALLGYAPDLERRLAGMLAGELECNADQAAMPEARTTARPRRRGGRRATSRAEIRPGTPARTGAPPAARGGRGPGRSAATGWRQGVGP